MVSFDNKTTTFWTQDIFTVTFSQIKTSSTSFWEWVDRRTIFRRAIVVFTLYLTMDATRQLIALYREAVLTHADLVGTAACIAAIAVLPGAVQKFAFTLYSEAKKEKIE
jgi:hypothetical protein